VKDEFVKLRVSAEEREAWQRSANVVDLSLSAYVRRCVEESQALESALDLQVESACERRRLEEAGEEKGAPRPQPRPPSPRPHRVNGYRGTIGDALAAADASAGFRPRP
jgi:hypothetical protein